MSLRAEPYGANAPFRLRARSAAPVARDSMRAIEHGAAELHRTHCRIRRRRSCRGRRSSVTHCISQIEPSPEVSALQPGFRAERRGAAFVALIAARIRHPLVFVVDDAQWADEASSELLSSIARSCHDRGWLMLVCAAQRRLRASGPVPTSSCRSVRCRRTTSGASSSSPAKRRRCARTTSTKWYGGPAAIRCSQPRSCARRVTWVRSTPCRCRSKRRWRCRSMPSTSPRASCCVTRRCSDAFFRDPYSKPSYARTTPMQTLPP